GSISLRRIALVWLWPIHPQPILLPSSMIFRVMVAHLALQRGAGADAVAAQYLHQPPDADAIAVITHCPVAHVGDLGLVARHAVVEVARHHVVEAEELDIRVHPTRHPSAARPGQRRAAVDGDISKRTVAARRHGRDAKAGGRRLWQ